MAASPAQGDCGPSEQGPTRRQRLEILRNREAVKGDLANKFRGGRGSERAEADDEASITSEALRAEVDRIADGASVTESTLDRLEQRLLRRFGEPPLRKESGNGPASARSVSEYTVGKSSVMSVGSRLSRRLGPALTSRTSRPGSSEQAGQLQVAAQGEVKARPPLAAKDVEWSVLDKLAAQQHHSTQMVVRQIGLEQQQRFKSDLHQQVLDAKLLKQREQDREMNLHRLQVDASAKMFEQERSRQAASEEKLQKTLRERAAQLEEDRARRALEAKKEVEEAQVLMDGISADLALNRRKAEERWQSCRKQAKLALDACSESVRKRELLAKAQEEQEKKSVEDYERLKKARESRMQAEKKKEAGQRQLMEEQAEARMAKQRLEHQMALDRMTEQLEEKNRQAAAKEKQAAKRLEEKRLQTQAYLREQMKQKLEKKVAESNSLRVHREQQEKDAQTFRDEEAQRAARRRTQLAQHRADLERQIACKAQAAMRDDLMNEYELKLNRDLLEQAVKPLALTDGA